MTQAELYSWIEEKSRILDKLNANAQTQIRFLQKLHVKGLKRILQEREIILTELAAVNNSVTVAEIHRISEVQTVLRAIQNKQQEILQVSQQALQMAIAEQRETKTKLQHLRAKRRIQNQYGDKRFLVYGNRINLKG